MQASLEILFLTTYMALLSGMAILTVMLMRAGTPAVVVNVNSPTITMEDEEEEDDEEEDEKTEEETEEEMPDLEEPEADKKDE